MEAMLSESVRALSDGGGEFFAARVPVVSRNRVITFLSRIAEMRGPPDHSELRTFNGLPAVVASYDHAGPNVAPRFVLTLRLDADERISELYTRAGHPEAQGRVLRVKALAVLSMRALKTN